MDYKKPKIKVFFICIMILLSTILFLGNKVEAAGEPYTIDTIPTTPPSFEGNQVIKVYTVDDMGWKLYDPSLTNVTFELQNDISFNTESLINGDKAINLNGHTMTLGTKGYFLMPNGSTTKKFKMYNGTIAGGSTDLGLGGLSSSTPDSAILNAHYSVNADIVMEDINYTSADNGGSFMDTIASNVFWLGNSTIKTYGANMRVGNAVFLGNFTGNAFGNRTINYDGTGYGGVNIIFAGYAYSYLNKANRGSQTMSKTNGDRRIYIAKESSVTLTNTNTSNLPSANNIGNFATIVIEGSLKATAYGTSLRTTASSKNVQTEYTNQAGTFNGQSNIYVNEDAKFVTESTAVSGSYGALYTYNTDVYAYRPNIFDMRYFGKGNFFYAYSDTPRSNLKLYDLDMAVWAKNQQGIGNPSNTVAGAPAIWQNVGYMLLINFWNNDANNVDSSDTTLNKNTFRIDDYSRVSNDITLPMIVPDDVFKKAGSTDQYAVNNGEERFYGSTDYYYPDGTLVNKKAAGASVGLYSGNLLLEMVQTDSNGDWSFNNFNSKKLSAGTYTLKMFDADKRTAKNVSVTVNDTIPPEATTKLYKFKQGTTTALTNPKGDSIQTFSDETTSSSKITFKYQLTEEERQDIIKTPGYYEVIVEVSDEAGNVNEVPAPVIVYEDIIPVTGFISGQDFEVDYDKWINANDTQKRDILIDEAYGKLKGYQISGSVVTDVTTDATKLTATFTGHTWEPKKTYSIQTNVPGYSKVIKVTLVPSEVKMSLKQVYAGTDAPIYTDLTNNTPIDNSRTFNKKTGDSLETVLNEMITKGDLKLNHTGYGTLDVKDFEVVISGVVVTPTPTVVPDVPFDLVYEYQGEMQFNEAPNLEFGKIEVSGSSQLSALETTSSSTVKIINTLLDYNWHLKLSLPEPEGISNIRTKETFLGDLVYYDSSTSRKVINQTGIEISSQKPTDKALSVFDVRGDSETGIRLEQKIGNRADKYSGDLLWSLEDTP